MIQMILSIGMLVVMVAFELCLWHDTKELIRTLKELFDEEGYEFKEFIKRD